MTTNYRPLYLVVTTSDMTLKQIQQNIKAIMYTRVSWERHINKKLLTQCHRCQGWGHATANCNRNPKCLKCASDHQTTDCTKKKETPAKCVNCGGAHPANATSCEAYIRKITEIGKRNPRVLERYERFKAQRDGTAPPETATKYVAAPEPTSNSWTQRQQQREQREATLRNAVPAPNINDYARFPSLTQRRRDSHVEQPTRQQPTPLSAPNPAQQQSDVQQELIYQTADIFHQLSDAINIMNSRINLSNLLNFVNNLNSELAKCNTTQSRVSITMSFMNQIDSYQI